MLSSLDTPRALTPPLKWAGGKRWLVPQIERLWQGHEHRRLVEPLCGGLAVTLGLAPPVALLNDVNQHAINFYRWAVTGFVPKLRMENDERLYYRHRERFNALIRRGGEQTQEAAELFYYLNRTGYNGLCRFNRKGEFNVPFGQYRTINYTRDFSRYKAFAAWEFIAGDFADVPLQSGDFIYADPPYDVEFRQYSAGGFEWADQVRLAEWLAAHEGPVVLSNQSTPRVVELYESLGFVLTYLSAPRRISCTGDRTPAREVLALKGL